MSETYQGPQASPFARSIVTPQQIEAAQEEKSRRTWAAIEARQKREHEQAAERERQLRAEGQARLEAYESERRQRWLDAGGDLASFSAAWPGIKQAWLIAESEDDPREAKTRAAYEKLKQSRQYDL